MHATVLTTRHSRDGFQGEECLLIYDEQHLTGTMLGDDIREMFDSRPAIARIYLLAPFVPEVELRDHLHSSAVFERMSSYFRAIGGRLCLLTICDHQGGWATCEIPYFVDEQSNPQQEDLTVVHDELRNGWLFDLFDRYRGRVDALPGVHFAKSSKKHSSKFLRVSNVLLTSSSCAVIAFFTLGVVKGGQPRRIFVDTAPLMGVALAIQRIAIMHNVWTMYAPVTSFSSYGEIDSLPPTSGRDLVLVSASTSGGLVAELTSREFDPNFIATLFYLGAYGEQYQAGGVVCDLGFRQGRTFGYTPIESFQAENCPLCRDGYFVAELEGDQFQLERRANKFLAIKTAAQSKDARSLLEELARRKLIRAEPFQIRGHSSDFSVDIKSMLSKVENIRMRFIRALRRFLPLPLNFVVLVDIDEKCFKEVVQEAGLELAIASAKLISPEELSSCSKLDEGTGGALVIFGALSNFAAARNINAQLRIKVPKGCVAYVAAITIANSAEHLADLKMFLTYGENGRDTHSYDAARALMLPAASVGATSWEAELSLLQRLVEEGDTEPEITNRIDELLKSAGRTDELFWQGINAPLAIQNDFVYLSVDSTQGTVSQADVLATVANLLASVRMDNRGLTSPIQAGKEPIRWHQSVYGHVMLSPASFEDYNDSILHACFLRCATAAELNYANDEAASERVLNVVRAILQAWPTGGGDSLPEFLLALAMRRLTLTAEHMDVLKREANEVSLPAYLASISRTIWPSFPKRGKNKEGAGL